jgi:hypothetical protein
MPRARFEPATQATKRPQTHALDRAATGIGRVDLYKSLNGLGSWMQTRSRSNSVTSILILYSHLSIGLPGYLF